ncbi:MAG: phosphatidylserine decarboxylase family protein [Bacteroidota bacterium]
MLKIHKEGKVVIPVGILILGLIWVGAYWIHPYLGYALILPGLIMSYLIIHFFRNPDIQSPIDPETILSPCDGKVVVIEQIEEKKYFKDKRWQISVFMSPLDIHVNRNPISGTIKSLQYYPGSYLPAYNPKSSELNEQNLVVVENDLIAVGYKQIAGIMARRILCYVKEGEEVKQGEEYGFIRFGSRVDVYLPLDADITVKLGDRVQSGQSQLAKVGK